MEKLFLTIRNLLFVVAILVFFGAAIVLLVKAFQFKALILGVCAVVVALFGLPTVISIVRKMTE